MDDNFDPGERFAATQGLRGAYDGSDFTSNGMPATDTSWVPEGYNYAQGQDKNWSLDGLFGGLSSKTVMNSSAYDLPKGINLASLLPGQYNRQIMGPGSVFGSYLNKDGTEGDLKGDLTGVVGENGITRTRAYNADNPYKWFDRYTNSEGKELGTKYGETSHGFLDKYGMTLGKMALAAGLGAAIGPMFAGTGSVGGTGLSATAAGGGTGAGMSVGAATGGTGAGLGTGAFAGFGSGATTGGALGGLGGLASGIGQSGVQAAINTALGGGDFGKSFLSNFLTSGLPTGNLGDFGEYTDLINKVGRGAAMGGLRGGGQGALMGGLNPVLSQGLNKVSDYFGNMGNQWEQDSFGSGGMSMGNNGGLQDYFKNFTGQQSGPMSTTAALQNGSNGANSIDWDSVLGGTQAFGNVNPQEPQATGLENTAGMQPMGFGNFFGNQMPGENQFSTLPAQGPTSTGSSDWGDYAKQIPDAAKAVLMARYPQLRGLLGGGARMSPIAAGAGALATIYTANKAQKALKKQSGQLDSLFGQNSDYAKTMKQELARKDAASGRRSQYGPREVELQARLAQMNGQLAPQRFQLANAMDQNRVGMYGGLLQYGEQSGLLDKLSKLLGS